MAIERLFSSLKQELTSKTVSLFEESARLSREGKHDEAEAVIAQVRATLAKSKGLDTILNDVLEKFSSLGIEQPPAEFLKKLSESDWLASQEIGYDKEVERDLPVITVYEQLRKVRIDGRIISFQQNRIVWPVFKYLLDNPQKEITSEQIKEIMLSQGSNDQAKDAGSQTVFKIRSKIEIDPKNPKLIETLNGTYRLNARVEFDIETKDVSQSQTLENSNGSGRKRFQRYDAIEYQLPDGQKIQITPFLAKLLDNLRDTSEENFITSEEIANRLYTDKAPMKSKTARISNAIKTLRYILGSRGWQIPNLNPPGSTLAAKYYLDRIITEQKAQ